MKSVRLNDELQQRLEEAARIAGVPESQFIREAVQKQCDAMLSKRLDRALADVIGSVECGGDARNTGKAFQELMKRKYKQQPPRKNKKKAG